MTSGDMLGPYKLGALLGRGGMGEVYRAQDTRLNRDVAVKILPEYFSDDRDHLRRFQKEARAAGALSHPNILAIFDVGHEGDTHYLVTELLEGETLRERMAKGRLSLTKIADYGKQAAAGLAAAHDKGIFHRDIKPDNLFITKHGLLKILDFGLAKTNTWESGPNRGSSLQMTRADSIVGTVPYMSPEQVLNDTIDGRSDLFSLGSVLYEMAAGVQPFRAETSIGVMNAILGSDAVELMTLNPEIPPALDQVVRHCMEKIPNDRFQSVRDLGFALDTLVSRQSIEQPSPGLPLAAPPRRSIGRIAAAALGAGIVVGIAAGMGYYRMANPVQAPVFQRLTFSRGYANAARFTPDGAGVVYSAQWEEAPVEVFDVRFDSPGARALGFPGMRLMAVSSGGELALSQDAHIIRNPFVNGGVLARAPISGGAPRAVEEQIDFADWSPDGKDLAVVRETKAETQLEYPVGKVLHRTSGYIGSPRISPSGDQIAFIDHASAIDNGGHIVVVGRDGKETILTRDFLAADGLAWRPRGDEIWFTAAMTGGRYDLRAVTLKGKERLIYSQSSSIVLHDIAQDGRILVSDDRARIKLVYRGPGESRDRDLSWLDWSLVSGISDDGKWVAFAESGDGAGDQSQVYTRETNGKPAVRLGPGGDPSISPDGRFVVATQDPSIFVYPIGTGQSRTFTVQGYTGLVAGLAADGQHIWFAGAQPPHSRRLYRLTIADGAIVPLSEDGMAVGTVTPTPDGKSVVAVMPDHLRLYHLDGGPPVNLPEIKPTEHVAGITTDSKAIFAYDRNELPARIFRSDMATGRRELVLSVQPGDSAGLQGGINQIYLTPNGKAYAYSLAQTLSELHTVTGLK